MIKNWRFLLLFFSMARSPAQAIIMEVTPAVILNAAASTQKQNLSNLGWTGDVATGFGFLTSFNLLDSNFTLETGAVYLNQFSERDSSGITIKQESHNLHLPLLIRYNFDEKMGIGIGGYAGIGQGSITTTQGGAATLSSYTDSGIHNRDFGLLISARASLRIISQIFFIVDGRYQHGLTNLANIPPGVPGDLLNTRSMQAYLGLSYRFIPF